MSDIQVAWQTVAMVLFQTPTGKKPEKKLNVPDIRDHSDKNVFIPHLIAAQKLENCFCSFDFKAEALCLVFFRLSGWREGLVVLNCKIQRAIMNVSEA